MEFAEANKFPNLEGEPEAGQWYRVPIPGAVSASGKPYWGYFRKGTEPNPLYLIILCVM